MPWNPVAIKNVDPKEESEIAKEASLYSNPWKRENTLPNKIVTSNEMFDLWKLFLSIWWWDHVIDTPEESNRIVFNKGIPMGLKGWIDKGGHIWPNSIVGENLLWKKLQKKETKNKTSDVINIIIPVFRPFMTNEEWSPWLEDSRWISRHQENDTKLINKSVRIVTLILIWFINSNPKSIIHIMTKDVTKGQGLFSTKWNGLNFFFII